MCLKIAKTLTIAASMALPTAPLAATVDGMLGSLDEYRFNTEAAPNDKHNTDDHGTSSDHGGNGDGGVNSEYNDGSNGDRYDINYLGFDIQDGQFQFGAVGGSILTDPHLGVDQNTIDRNPLLLGDIAINVTTEGAAYQDPTQNTAGSNQWDYAVRILDMAADSFSFSLLTADNPEWLDLDIYGREATDNGHHTDTFRMENGTAIADDDGNTVFTGILAPDTDPGDGSDDYLLEGSFDLSLLSLFDEQTGGRIITYLTMSCVNDEAIVVGDISPVPLPSAVWLFGSALLGFIGMSRRTRV